jgi:hypothetical protein
VKGTIERYLQLFFRLQLAQWENYAAGAKHDLAALDGEIYACLRDGELSAGDLTAETLIFWGVRRRGLVDRDPAVSRLRNRLDDWDNYLGGLLPVDPAERRRLLAERMRPDVLQLMQLRDRLAREQGFPSYPELVLQTEGLDPGWVRQTVADYLHRHLDEARELIATNKIQWATWFTDLEQLGNIQLRLEAEAISQQLLEQLGLADALRCISLQVREDGLAGYTGVIRPRSDVRILIRPVTSLSRLITLCHELGHAVCHALNQAKGLAQTWTASYDEAMAVLLEQIGVQLLLPEDMQRQARQIALLENVRCAISFLFELELWRQPHRAEELYLEHYGQLGLELGNPLLWALDSFRSIDPVYIQNYVLGAVLAERTIDRLADLYGNDYRAWGEGLRERYAAGAYSRRDEQ